ncbi:MAG: YjjW family glycine radical enzyme activase [Clostridiales bacterium]|nr:YjjW family glycine radical enzyme activase [Clostridiales bacterium]
MSAAPVNRIIPYSSVDGPGNRTVFFFQGCNFNCGYCHNPETIGLCSNCGACVSVCPTGAIRMEDGVVRYRREVCCGCDACLCACPRSASPKVDWMEPEEGIELLRQYRPFIRGVTVSGGECTLRRAFVIRLFEGAKEMGLHTLMDSNGNYDFSADEPLLRVCDGVMLDVKCVNAKAHRALTGRENDLVLKSLSFLASAGKLEEVRTVVVPDLLPNEDTVRRVCEKLSPHWRQGARIGYKLIRFRPLGVRANYRSVAVPDMQTMDALSRIALDAGCPRVLVV